MTTRRQYDNLMSPLFTIAFAGDEPIVRHYHADLGHDAVTLSTSQKGDVFLWGPRDCGSHLFKLNHERGSDYLNIKTLALMSVKPEHWHVIRVLDKSGPIATGTLERLGATTFDEVVTLAKRARGEFTWVDANT